MKDCCSKLLTRLTKRPFERRKNGKVFKLPRNSQRRKLS